MLFLRKLIYPISQDNESLLWGAVDVSPSNPIIGIAIGQRIGPPGGNKYFQFHRISIITRNTKLI